MFDSVEIFIRFQFIRFNIEVQPKPVFCELVDLIVVIGVQVVRVAPLNCKQLFHERYTSLHRSQQPQLQTRKVQCGAALQVSSGSPLFKPDRRVYL